MENAMEKFASMKQGSEGKYDVLYLNTPWTNLSDEKMGKLPLADICNENAALFMWTDSFTIERSCQLLKKWGFEFHSVYQIMDIGQHSWMTKKNLPPPPPARTEEDHAKMEDEGSNDKTKLEVTKPPRTLRKPRVPPVSPPVWWSESRKDGCPFQPMTEQLWLAKKGDISSIFRPNVSAYTVINCPEIGKKAYSKGKWKDNSQGDSEDATSWNYVDRPSCFLETVLSHVQSSTKVLDVFSSTLHEKADSWGPGLPGGYLTSISKGGGLVGIINRKCRAMKKNQLNVMSTKICKILDKALADKERAEIMDELRPSLSVISEALENEVEGELPMMSYEWRDENGEMTNWILQVIHKLASWNYRNFSTSKKKRKKCNNNTDGSSRANKPRHGIACASEVSKELGDFLKMKEGEKIARTTVVSKLNEYICKNGLQNPERKVEIILDDALTKLLSPPPDFGKVTYFNLCKLVGKHFPKSKA